MLCFTYKNNLCYDILLWFWGIFNVCETPAFIILTTPCFLQNSLSLSLSPCQDLHALE